MALDSTIQEIQRLIAQSASDKNEATAQFNALRQKILNGETTGDKITDFVIVHLGDFSSEVQRPYRETEKRLKNGTDKQILIELKSETIMGCTGATAPDYISLDHIGIATTLSLGILTSGLELDLKEGRVIFPMTKYAEINDRSATGKWTLNESHVSYDSRDFLKLNKRIPRRTKPMRNDSDDYEHSIAIHLGEEVEQYFSNSSSSKVSYVEALMLLNQDVPAPLKTHYDGAIYQKRKEIISKLAVYTNQTENNSLIAEIKFLLKKGIELNMHTGTLEISVTPGVTINVPDYITNLCNKYSVDLPK